MKLRVRKNLVWMIIVALVVSIMVTAPGTSSPEVLLHVDPPLSSEPPTETFDIYVTAGTEEEPVANLFLGEFTLSWDPPLLYTDVDNINLGDVAPYLDFIWAEEVNNDEGWLKVTVGRPLGTKEGLSGTVQIAKITFLVEAEGSCTLHLYDTRLKDLGGADLDHMTEDGRFEYPTVERGSIAGEVTDTSTGLPISGATVSAVGPETHSTTTAADGTYTLADIEVGTYSVTASATGYQDQTKSATVTKGKTTTLDFDLTPLPTTGTISGTVTDADTTEPIEGATVTANGVSTSTNAEGYYEIEIEAGTYDVTAEASGYISDTKPATVTVGETVTVDFALIPIVEVGWIEGTVTDADTLLPIEGATVTANGVFVTTGADGSYSIEIAPGTYTITAETSGYYSDTQTGIVVEAGEITTLDFALELIVGWIDGYVTDADTGDAIAGATVTADGVSVSTDAEGYYKIEIAPETYTVTASMSGYYDGVVLDVSVTAGETVTVDFALEPVPPEVGWIEGTVTDAKTGSAIVGATVTADGVSVSTGAEGYYKIEIAPGMYTVTASMSGYVDGVVSDVTVTAGVTATVDFALEPLPGAIDGTVTDALTGSPIAGVYIAADTYSAITDAYGYYMIADVQPGDYTVTASVDGYFSDSKPAHVESSVTTTVEFALLPVPLPLGTIAGTVKDFDTGLPIAGAVVSADGYSATTDESGAYSISDLEPKTYVVTASATGYESQSKSVTVTAGETTTVDFALTPAAATIDSLIALVDEFYELGYIDDLGIKDSLLDKLYAAKAKIERGQARTAKNILNAFINHVKAQRGKHISTEKADILVSNAQLIINNL